MELEQLSTRLDWLDEERRKDRSALALLEERVKGMEKDLAHLRTQLKKGESLTPASSLMERLTQLEQMLAQQRVESGRQMAELETRLEALATTVSTRHAEFEETRRMLTQLRKSLDIKPLRRDLQARVAEEERLARELAAIKQQMEAITRTQEDIVRAQQTVEEGHLQDAKRLTELQGDVLAVRKRVDTAREAVNQNAEGLRRLEMRLNELVASETERRQAQIEFLESQARLQVERERTWKEWEQHFETLAQQTRELDTQLRAWEVAQRAVKRAQEAYEEMIQKFERRINEIAEMQRLAEDRARQEWTAFRAEDQKRWANYTLTQEETLHDIRGEVEQLETRLTALEDLVQTQQDILIQTKEANEQMLHTLLAQIHELLSAYERILGVIQPGR